MLSRHRFCCYIVFALRVTLTLVRVTHFTHYSIYNFSIYLLFLSVICIGLHSVVDIMVDFEIVYPGFESRESHVFLIFFCLFFFMLFLFVCLFVFFLSLLLQCKFAISTLLPLFSFSYFITPYDAQASSAFSALILYIALKQHPVSKCNWSGFKFSMLTMYWLGNKRYLRV